MSRRSPLPEGALPVGAGLVVNGALAYGFLLLTARALEPAEYSSLSVLWAVAFTVGPGLFFPLEQELARVVSARKEHGLGASGVVRQAALAGGGLVVLLVAVCLAVRETLIDRLFTDNATLASALALSFISFFALHVIRGVLAGSRRFVSYGVVSAGEGVARMAVCVGLFWTGANEPGPYGLGLTLAPLVALFVFGAGRFVDSGPMIEWGKLGEQIGFLLVGSLLSQLLVNLGPVAVQLLARPEQGDAAGRFLASLVITRVPLFLFFAVQAALLPKLAAHASVGRFREFGSTIDRLVLTLFATGALGVGAAFLFGEFVVRTLFGASYELPRMDLAMLAAAAAFFILALAMASALVALKRPALVAAAWLAGNGAYVLVIVLGSDLFMRVEVGFLIGSAVAALVMGALLRTLLASPDKLRSARGPEVAATTPPVVIEP